MNKHLSQYSYHYNTEYPIEMFIKNVEIQKNGKSKKNKYYNAIKSIEHIKNDETIIMNNYCNNIVSNPNFSEKEKKNKNQSIKKYEYLKSNYYNSIKYFAIYNSNTDNIKKILNGKINLININNSYIDKYNSEIIYTYYEIYDKFLSKNYDFQNIYNDFKRFVKDNNIIENILNINITINLLFKRTQKCYNIIIYVIENNIVDKNKIINLFYMSKLNIEILSRLNEESINRLKVFFKNKYEQDYNLKCREIDSNNILEKYSSTEIRNICNDIPITYIGSKRKISNKILSSIPFNNNTKKFIDLFGGSLCISYLIKTLYPSIEIIAYENDKLLLNFYNVLKYHYNDFISRLNIVIDGLKKSQDRKTFIKNIVNIINIKLETYFMNSLEIACYYYVINKICFRGVLNYNEQNKISITINDKRICTLLKFSRKHEEKLYKYSIFLNKISLINMNVTQNYNEILKIIDKNTILYADPPYDSDNKRYKPYQYIFDKNKHMELKIFLDKAFGIGCNWLKNNRFTGYILDLFSRYRSKLLNVKNNICNSSRMDLLITSF